MTTAGITRTRHGVCDAVCNMANIIGKVKDTSAWIRRLDRVRSTLTTIVVEG